MTDGPQVLDATSLWDHALDVITVGLRFGLEGFPTPESVKAGMGEAAITLVALDQARNRVISAGQLKGLLEDDAASARIQVIQNGVEFRLLLEATFSNGDTGIVTMPLSIITDGR